LKTRWALACCNAAVTSATYEDLDDNYDKRPSAWIEPQGDWGKGTVDLVEIPTADETNDNIVAFWSPDVCLSRSSLSTLSYRLHWTRWTKPPCTAKDSAWVSKPCVRPVTSSSPT
jgi:periplasmic glucans biosynthesis protein